MIKTLLGILPNGRFRALFTCTKGIFGQFELVRGCFNGLRIFGHGHGHAHGHGKFVLGTKMVEEIKHQSLGTSDHPTIRARARVRARARLLKDLAIKIAHTLYEK